MKNAHYEVEEYENGVRFKTTVEWRRSYGKCNSQTFWRHGEIYSQKQYTSWCKRNGVAINEEHLKLLPKKPWWEN